MKTGNTAHSHTPRDSAMEASMEPGHEDREYADNTRNSQRDTIASMEPGHEDREYLTGAGHRPRQQLASMEPGHEDREYRRRPMSSRTCTCRLNGARS